MGEVEQKKPSKRKKNNSTNKFNLDNYSKEEQKLYIRIYLLDTIFIAIALVPISIFLYRFFAGIISLNISSSHTKSSAFGGVVSLIALIPLALLCVTGRFIVLSRPYEQKMQYIIERTFTSLRAVKSKNRIWVWLAILACLAVSFLVIWINRTNTLASIIFSCVYAVLLIVLAIYLGYRFLKNKMPSKE